ncbi:bacterial low temperature requirement A protein-domain-containing protein [Jimgerdemannia flammicorona]|uniref:Bacterial low temperature requirement A protein-domain-containing protein n=1 Tax=Jimgerdemannia flammicorona TaxID=994334 RepID=A0A433QDJ1_9FUNG|nr:bacterial low temperature requirement A protein-domain-containing protein [Jimgerdemannia flammicorona]
MPSPLRIKTASQRRVGGNAANTGTFNLSAHPSTYTPHTPHSDHLTPAMLRGPGFHDHGTVHHVMSTHRTTSMSTNAEPVYEHGHETFGDLIANPFKQLQAHRDRIKKFEEAKERYAKKKASGNKDSKSLEAGDNEKEPEVTLENLYIIHFRRLTGDHGFTLTPEQRQKIEIELRLTPNERQAFMNVMNSDTLVDFFDRTGRESAMKIHTDEENAKYDKEKQEEEAKAAKDPIYHADGRTLNDSGPVDITAPHSVILELNSNMFIEVKKVTAQQLEEEEEEDEITRRPFFAPPDVDLSDDIGEEKSASWLELFYDLFYIASLSEFTHSHHIVNFVTLGQYAGWFVILWWSWTASSLYTTRFDTNDVMHHLYKLIEMCAVVGMAGASSHYLDAPKGFIIGYMVLKAILVIEYGVVFIMSVISGSKSRGALACYVAANFVAIILWGVSFKLMPEDELHDPNRAKRLALWYLSIVIEIGVNVGLKDSKRVSLAASHIAERFGLLTLIVLGENLMGFVKMVAEAGLSHQVVIANMLAVIIIFGFFFMYFDDFSKEVLAETDLNQIWMYLHFPLHLCQVAFGIALTDTLLLYEKDYRPVEASTNATSHSTSTSHSVASSALVGLTHAIARAVSAHGNITTTDAHSSTNTTTDIAQGTNATSTNSTVDVGSQENLSIEGDPAASFIVKVFVYKTFLIGGGLIMTLNTFIKLLHTELNNHFSLLICGSRIVNAVILWAMVALPFADLSGIVLICIMAGSVVIQGMIDLLD